MTVFQSELHVESIGMSNMFITMEFHKCASVYFLVAGGYDKEAHLMCPKAWPVFLKDVMWSEWLESCQKDVECTFGILRACWRWLRSQILYKSMDLIGHAIRTAGILHNVLLTWGNLETDYTRTEAY